MHEQNPSQVAASSTVGLAEGNPSIAPSLRSLWSPCFKPKWGSVRVRPMVELASPPACRPSHSRSLEANQRQKKAVNSAADERNSAALSSVGAAVFLTGLKIVVGLLSGSLGILAEAAHSGLDFLAALITLVAVRAASKPADRDHTYGHGKVENLSALAETLLLLGTCVWIIYQSVDRLTHNQVKVHASVWAFAVMIISIVVDLSRSRMLYRVAHKHRSQALEADALHFSTDVWSSFVVILGLVGVKIAAAYPGLAFLEKADAVAALMVAAIVVVVSGKLGLRTIQGLLDASPEGVADQIKARVEAMERVIDCHAVRVRHSGPHYFVDLHITLDGSMTLDAAHALTEEVERAVMVLLPGADVTVHPEPGTTPTEPKHPDQTRP
jgi:cation diffusion facilitator family transporter